MYVLQGLDYPLAAYLFHAVKLALFVARLDVLLPLHARARRRSRASRRGSSSRLAFQKAFIWASLFEVLGLRLHERAARAQDLAAVHGVAPLPAPGHDEARRRSRTCRSSAARRARGSTSRSTRRSSLSLLRALVQPAITAGHLLPIVVLLPLCGLGDKTIFLAARVEHHFAMIVCFAFARATGSPPASGCSSRSGSGPACRS